MTSWPGLVGDTSSHEVVEPEAHRRDVIANVARDIGVDVKNIPEDLENAMIVSFEETWRDEARRATYGFHLRFGEGSHRWGLKLATAH